MSETINPERPLKRSDSAQTPTPAPASDGKNILKRNGKRIDIVFMLVGAATLGFGEYNIYRWRLIEYDILGKAIELPSGTLPSDVKDGSVVQLSGVVNSSSSPLIDHMLNPPIRAPAGSILLQRKMERYQRYCTKGRNSRCSMKWMPISAYSGNTTNTRSNVSNSGASSSVVVDDSIQDKSFVAQDVRIGHFQLDGAVIENVRWKRTLAPNDDAQSTIAKLRKGPKGLQWKCDQTHCYSGNMAAPANGDLRVRYDFAAGDQSAVALGRYNATDKRLHSISTIFGNDRISSLIEAPTDQPVDKATSVRACAPMTLAEENWGRAIGLGFISFGAMNLGLRPLAKTVWGASIAASVVMLPRVLFLLKFGRVILPFAGSVAVVAKGEEEALKKNE